MRVSTENFVPTVQPGLPKVVSRFSSAMHAALPQPEFVVHHDEQFDQNDVALYVQAMKDVINQDYRGFFGLCLTKTSGGHVFEQRVNANTVPITVVTLDEAIKMKQGLICEHHRHVAPEYKSKNAEDWPLLGVQVTYYKKSNCIVLVPQVLHVMGGTMFTNHFVERVTARYCELSSRYPDYTRPARLAARINLNQDETGLFPVRDNRFDAGERRVTDILTGIPQGAISYIMWLAGLVFAAPRTGLSLLFNQAFVLSRPKQELIDQCIQYNAEHRVNAGESGSLRPSAFIMREVVAATVSSRLGNIAAQLMCMLLANVWMPSATLKLTSFAYAAKLASEVVAENTTRLVVNIRNDFGEHLNAGRGSANNLTDLSPYRVRLSDAIDVRGAINWFVRTFTAGMVDSAFDTEANTSWYESLVVEYSRVINRAGPEGRVLYNKCLEGIKNTKLWFISLILQCSKGLMVAYTSWNAESGAFADLPKGLHVSSAQSPLGLRDAGKDEPSINPLGYAVGMRLGDRMAVQMPMSLYGLEVMKQFGGFNAYRVQFANDAYMLPFVHWGRLKVADAGDQLTSFQLSSLAVGALITATVVTVSMAAFCRGVDAVLPVPALLQSLESLARRVYEPIAWRAYEFVTDRVASTLGLN